MVGDMPSSIPDDPPTLGPVLDFLRLWWSVDHQMNATSKHMERTLGVTGRQRLVIRVVGAHPGTTSGGIARLLHVHPSTLTQVLRRLETRVFLTRFSDPKDARLARFRLTALGATMNDVEVGTVEAAVARALARLSPHEVAGARTVLAALEEECAHLRETSVAPGAPPAG